MFCDLVGSTALSLRLDLEDLRDVIAAYHAGVAETISRHGGFVAKYMGDGVLVYFGFPQAHEHDAERAVRAGLDLVQAVGRLSTAVGTLQARVGIATGLVVVGDLIGSGEAQERGVVGETPNLAARLQAHAEPNAVVIAEATRRLTGGLFEYRDLGAVVARGFAEPISAFWVLGESAVENRFEALRTGQGLLVGREEEVELLVRRWKQARGSEGRVALLSGEPGIGKSRLTAALQEKLEAEPHLRLRYFCSPHHSQSPLYPVITQLEHAAGFTREDTADQKHERLEALLAPGSPSPEEQALLAELLSVPWRDNQGPIDLSPQKRKERTLSALMRQLEILARHRPVLMLWEDVHWIDPTSGEFLDLLVARVQDLPVLLVITFRPEFQPPWTGQAHVMTLVLNRLGRRERAALVQGIVGNEVSLPGDVIDEIIERTDGVPLFVEELTKAVLEAGASGDPTGRTLSATPSAALVVPATLQASLMARLDRLGPAAKEIAQIGAAIGREFSHELLTAVANQSARELQLALDPLAKSGLLLQRGTLPAASWTFKHALVHDAAYSTLLRGRRQALHRRIAKVLEEQFPEIVETQPEAPARHLAEAGLVEPAIAYWRKAAARALRHSSNSEAASHLTKAIELLIGWTPETNDRDQFELDLLIELGGPLIATRGYGSTECGRLFARARALCGRLDDTPKLFPVLYGQWVYEYVRGRGDLAMSIAEQFLRDAERFADEDREFELLGNRLLGSTLLSNGKIDLALPHLHRSIAAYDARHHAPLAYVYGQNPHVSATGMMAYALTLHGYPDQGRNLVLKAVHEARTLDHFNTLAWALWHASVFRLLRRELAAAETTASEVVEIARDHGAVFWETTGRAMLSCAYAGQEPSPDNTAQLGRDLAAAHELAWGNFRPSLDLLAADILRAAGDEVQALALAQQTKVFVEDWSQHLLESEYHRVYAEILLATGASHGEIEASLARAIEIARRQNARCFELRAATSLARFWNDCGRRAEARDLLTPIYGWFTEGFDTPDLKEAKVLLDQISA